MDFSMFRIGRLPALILGVLTASSCNYSFSAGSFPPQHIETIAIEPFDNTTNRFELSAEL